MGFLVVSVVANPRFSTSIQTEEKKTVRKKTAQQKKKRKRDKQQKKNKQKQTRNVIASLV